MSLKNGLEILPIAAPMTMSTALSMKLPSLGEANFVAEAEP